VARAVEIDHVKVLRYRRKTADLIMAAGTGWREGLVRTAIFSADMRSPPGRAFQTGEPVSIPHTAKVSGFVISDVLKDHGVISLVNVPILFNGAAWGVLEVDSPSPRDFAQDTIDFLMAAAAIIASALHRDSSERGEVSAVTRAAVEAQQRELLFNELQHRVKNGFQIILASVALQKRRFENPEVHRVLDHVANRIMAISLAHDQLAIRQNMQVADVAAYLRALCSSIEQQADNVAIEVDADEIELSIDRMVPLGLILNEAATNSVKHAFGDDGGRITVTLRAGIGYGEARLTVADNGQGIRNPRPGGSGLNLIGQLARQIGGDVTRESSEHGTLISVVFPIIS